MERTAISASRRAMGATVVAAVALGLLAFAADLVDGAAGQVAIALTSSGFAWGLAAFLVARATGEGLRAAVVRATGLLATATVVYYLLVLVGTRRWMAGGVVAAGLADVGLMTVLWLAGSVVAGVLFGVLGRLVRLGSGRPGRTPAVALGLACGLLSSEGWARGGTGLVWLLLDPGEPFSAGVAAGRLLLIGLPVVLLIWLATVHRLWSAWPALLGAAAVSGAVAAKGWLLLGQVTEYAMEVVAIRG